MIQSSIGNVLAGSPFTLFQSGGAGGAGLTTIHAVTKLGGAFLMATGVGNAVTRKLREAQDLARLEETSNTPLVQAKL
jgi:hypothetical protein